MNKMGVIFMLKKVLLILFLVFSIISFNSPVYAENSLKAAFVRGDDLWIKVGDRERRITAGAFVRYPKWSFDGQWVAYLKDGDSPYNGALWLYNIKINKHFKVKSNITRDFQWSPRENKIGFLKGKDLFVLNTGSSFLGNQAAVNIENFSWLPDGKGLLTSSKESEKLNSDIILSKVLLGRHKPVTKHFYTVPVGENELYISTSQFKWSYDHKWISFLMVPTASLSADGNMLCVLSSDGKIFKRVDEMLNYEEWFQWGPAKNTLGYISGAGREALKNKQLKTVSVPDFHRAVHTPKGFADRDFAWKNNDILYASRSKESELVDVNNRPLPSIFEVSKKQVQVTFPPKREGDFAPEFVNRSLIWVRTDRERANVFVSRNAGEDLWIKDITLGTWYYEKWHWDEVLDLYEGMVIGIGKR
jgi:hypothetical protein